MRPLDRVGVYTPGGTAAYPSSLLMTAIPARVAGVQEIVVCTPAGADGEVSPLVLAAAEVAGVDRLFRIDERRPLANGRVMYRATRRRVEPAPGGDESR